MSTLSNIRDALEARSARYSFRAKLGLVWVLIFVVLGGSLRGLPVQHGVHAGVAAFHPRRRAPNHLDLRPRYPARHSARAARGFGTALEEPRVQRRKRLLCLLYPGDAPDRPDLLYLPR